MEELSARPLTGLLVEDVKAMRTYLRSMLEDDRTRISETSSLGEARGFLRHALRFAPDFILLDLDLPDGNGLDLMPDVPSSTLVVALTADVDRETELQCMSAGCDLVIEKSHQLASLREVIANRIGMKAEQYGRGAKLCSSYITFLAETKVEIEEARSNADFLAARRIAHRLRGTAIHFGFPGIASAAKSVCAALSVGQLEQFEVSILSLRDRIGDALETHHRASRRRANEEAPA